MNPVNANAAFRKNPTHPTTLISSDIHGAVAARVTKYHEIPSIPAAARRPLATTGHPERTRAVKASTVRWRESGLMYGGPGILV